MYRSKFGLTALCIFLLCVCVVVFELASDVGATGGAFYWVKHGGGTTDGNTPHDVGNGPGVDRSANPDYTTYYNEGEPLEGGRYIAGECTHCHEPHASFGTTEPDPNTGQDLGPDAYLAFKSYGDTDNYAELCWYCHENFSDINTSGSPLGYGRFEFYKGKAVFQTSSHYLSSDFIWPEISGADIHPRKNRGNMSSGNEGSCLNCHTPHGIMEPTGGTEYDKTAVPIAPTNMHLAVNNASVSVDNVIPRQLIAWEEALCENCHDASGPAIDIQSEINKRPTSGGGGGGTGSGHPVDDTGYAGLHVVTEGVPIGTKHVECYDCHNPHAVSGHGSSGTVGNADFNRLAGMKYVKIDGAVTENETEGREPYVYELCLRCHGNGYTTFIEPDVFAGIYDEAGQPNAANLQPLRTTAGDPASANTWGSNKRLEFDPTSIGTQALCNPYIVEAWSDCSPTNSVSNNNSAFHPVVERGRNQSDEIERQLTPAGLSRTNSIQCTDCHNNDATNVAQGPVTESNVTRADDIVPPNWVGTDPVGPHASDPAAVGGYKTRRILRANYNTTLGIWVNPCPIAPMSGPNNGCWDKPFASYDPDNFALCFLCHDSDAFECQPATNTDCDGSWDISTNPKTNFASIFENSNLHAAHIAGNGDVTGGTTTTCANCHYNVHSNLEAANTMYDDSSFADWTRNNDGSRLINFSPIVQPTTNWGTILTRPFWGCAIWTSVQRKGCDFNCHGFEQQIYYTAPNVGTTCP